MRPNLRHQMALLHPVDDLGLGRLLTAWSVRNGTTISRKATVALRRFAGRPRRLDARAESGRRPAGEAAAAQGLPTNKLVS